MRCVTFGMGRICLGLLLPQPHGGPDGELRVHTRDRNTVAVNGIAQIATEL